MTFFCLSALEIFKHFTKVCRNAVHHQVFEIARERHISALKRIFDLNQSVRHLRFEEILKGFNKLESFSSGRLMIIRVPKPISANIAIVKLHWVEVVEVDAVLELFGTRVGDLHQPRKVHHGVDYN